jgi:hypothetical protein
MAMLLKHLERTCIRLHHTTALQKGCPKGRVVPPHHLQGALGKGAGPLAQEERRHPRAQAHPTFKGEGSSPHLHRETDRHLGLVLLLNLEAPRQGRDLAMNPKLGTVHVGCVTATREELLPAAEVTIEKETRGSTVVRHWRPRGGSGPGGTPKWVEVARLVPQLNNLRTAIGEHGDPKQIVFQHHHPMVAVRHQTHPAAVPPPTQKHARRES